MAAAVRAGVVDRRPARQSPCPPASSWPPALRVWAPPPPARERVQVPRRHAAALRGSPPSQTARDRAPPHLSHADDGGSGGEPRRARRQRWRTASPHARSVSQRERLVSPGSCTTRFVLVTPHLGGAMKRTFCS